MGLRSGSVRLALCAMLIGTTSAWALTPHDKAVGPGQAAHSQPPPPAVGVQGRHQQADAATNGDGRFYELRGTEQVPLIIKSAPSEDAQAKAAEDAAERKSKAASDRWLIILTAVLAIATIALVIVTGGLVWFAWQQSADIKESVSAAKKSADIAEQSLVSIQRAFVYFETINATGLQQNGSMQGWLIDPVWRNSGTTPTRNMRSHACWQAFPSDITNEFDFPDIGLEPFSIPHMFIPGNGRAQGTRIHIPVYELVDVRAHDQVILIWGWAEYDDIFENTNRHRTEFCLKLDVPGDPTSIDFKHISLTLHTSHNGAEAECMKKPTYLGLETRKI